MIGMTGYNAHARDFLTRLNKIINLKIRNFTVGESWRGLKDDPHEGELYLTDEQKKMIGEQTVINPKREFVDAEIYDGLKNYNKYDFDLVLNETRHHYFYE